MANRIGDRYACSDCGCEVEISRPCSISSAEEESAGTSSSMRRDFRSEPTSTVGDFGDQGATGEGTFGGAGKGDPKTTASGRYDTESTRLQEPSGRFTDTLTCFCGSKMREVGSGRRAQVTGAGSNI
jgi:hypothetical protein